MIHAWPYLGNSYNSSEISQVVGAPLGERLEEGCCEFQNSGQLSGGQSGVGELPPAAIPQVPGGPPRPQGCPSLPKARQQGREHSF